MVMIPWIKDIKFPSNITAFCHSFLHLKYFATVQDGKDYTAILYGSSFPFSLGVYFIIIKSTEA